MSLPGAAQAELPLPAYQYRVTIGDRAMGFAEVTGLSIHHEPVVYRHGMSFLLGEVLIPGRREPTRVTLKKGVFKGSEFLSDWMQAVFSRPLSPPRKDILIDLVDGAGTPLVRWHVKGALPVRLDAPTFSASTQEIAVESLELMATGLEIQHLNGK